MLETYGFTKKYHSMLPEKGKKIGSPRPFPFVQLWKKAMGGECGKLESSIQSMTKGAS
jgi:hypothetical protein